jgi:TPP-dependent pyruvate/acetoin dehydrogenase alpha subunit
MYDPELYRSKEEVEQWKTRCPIATLQRQLFELQLISKETLTEIEDAVRKEIDEAIIYAESGSWEPVEDLTKDVYTR